MNTEARVNGVNIALTPTYPHDGCCPVCQTPIEHIVTETVPWTRRDFEQAIEPQPILGPMYKPCRHDAGRSFNGPASDRRW